MKRLLWIVSVLLVATRAKGQVITTVAGADPVFLSRVLPALTAYLSDSSAVAVDASGNFYLADAPDNIVARVSPDGIFTVVAGNGRAGFSGDGGPAQAASLNSPAAVAIDSSGNLYISDQGNRRIRKVSAGVISTIGGTGNVVFSGEGGPALSASFFPNGIAVDTSGSVYIADSVNNRVLRISNGRLTTISGTGTPGFGGDNDPAIGATLNAPMAVAVTASGVIYILDTGNVRVRRIANGSIVTIAGTGDTGFGGDGGPATAASFFSPFGMALDSSGNLYIADTGNNRVRKIVNGVITTIAGTGVPGFSGDGGSPTAALLFNPLGVAVDAAGSVFIADRFNRRVRRIANGAIQTVAGSNPPSLNGVLATGAILGNVNDVAVDSSGNLYLADVSVVRKLAGGILTVAAGGGTSTADGVAATSASLSGTTHVAVDTSGNLYISDSGGNRVRKVSGGIITTVAGNGTAGLSGDGPATSVSLSAPAGIAIDSSGNLYIADQGNNRVRKVSAGSMTTIAGAGTSLNDGGAAVSASLSYPTGLALDASGNLYIADTLHQRIRKISGSTITTVAGNGQISPVAESGSATSIALNAPNAVVLDSAGNLYISDTNNHRVRKVTGDVLTTVAGNGTKFYSGDGGPALSASLSAPSGLAIDAAGNLFIADSGNRRVRELLGRLPSYQVSTTDLTFTGLSGSSSQGTKGISLTTPVPGLAFTATVSANTPWLTVNPTSGTIPATLEVSVDPSTLSPQTYQGTITITAPFALPASTSIPVTLNVGVASAAVMSLDLSTLNLTAFQGGDPLTQPLTIRNTGSGSFPYTASAKAADFPLTVSPAAGTTSAAAPVTLTVTAAPGSLRPGTYSGTVTISGPDKPVDVPVKLSVAAPSASILLPQTALSFTAVAQGGVPLPQTLHILNNGTGSLDWTAEATTTLANGKWLQISQSSGTVVQPLVDVSPVTVTVDPSGLDAGTYYGQIKVKAPAINSPQSITVILSVLPPGTTAPPVVSPGALIFTSLPGVTPGSQDIQIGNLTAANTSFLSASTGLGFRHAPGSGTLAARQPTVLRIYPDFSDMTAGSVRQGSITLQFSDPRFPPQKIPVLLIATSATAGNAVAHATGVHPQAVPDCQKKISMTPISPTQPRLDVTPGQPMWFAGKLSNACGDLIGPDKKPSVIASLSGSNTIQAPMKGTVDGVWETSWAPAVPGTTWMQMVVLLYLADGSLASFQTPTFTIQVDAQSTIPTFTAQGVVHSASGLTQATVAPGELISIYGDNLFDPNESTVVTLKDVPLPVTYAGAKQLNVQVPYALPVNLFNQLQVQRGTALSVPRDLQAAAAQPGIFTVSQTGTGQGAIVRSDGLTLAQPGSPAQIGETIVIYCTGLGSVTPGVKEGEAPGPSTTVDTVTVTIGGKPAPVAYAGLTPGSAGLYQINTIVPVGVAPGDAVQVVLTEANQSSPPVTIAVAPQK